MIWREIISAPGDGTRILTFRQGFAESMAVAWFNSEFREWVPVHGVSWPEPTHWAWLPEPPTLDTKAET